MNRNGWLYAGAAVMTIFSMAASADEQAIRQALKSRIPNAQILMIQKLPYAGLYEVAVQRGADTAIYSSKGKTS